MPRKLLPPRAHSQLQSLIAISNLHVSPPSISAVHVPFIKSNATWYPHSPRGFHPSTRHYPTAGIRSSFNTIIELPISFSIISCLFFFSFLFHAFTERAVLAGVFSDGRSPGMCDLETMAKTKNVRQRRMRVPKLRYKVHAAAEGDRDSELTENVASDSSGDRVLTSEKEAISVFDFDCGLYSEISIIGRRKEMEDEVRVELGLTAMNDEKYDFFAVYDGHGGAQVAQLCRERLHRIVAEEIVDRGEIDAAEWGRLMERCFERMDDEVISGVAVMKTVGSAVVAVVAGKDEVVVANCGDCRAVLARAGISLPLSDDHKPGRADELKRIESAGGRVINWNGYRVLGVLATSRSIGDEYLKPFVISKPEVTVTKRTDQDEFLILGSDGLWDVVSNEIACNVVRRCFRGKMKRISLKVANDSHVAEAAAVLAELAVARGSKDNISVIVVDLRKLPNNSSP